MNISGIFPFWIQQAFFSFFLVLLTTGCTEFGQLDKPLLPVVTPPPCGTLIFLPAKPVCRKPVRSYCIKGKRYYPQNHCMLTQEGFASHYGEKDGCHGGPTSSGECFDKNGMTAAHKTLPLRCFIRVDNLENGHALILRVNDRGPFCKGRILDVSVQAAKKLGFYNKGVARVRVTALGKNPSVSALMGPGISSFSFSKKQKVDMASKALFPILRIKR